MIHSVEYIVIGGYLILLMVLGAVFSRFNHNVSDYFRNGCRGTWWLVGASALMSGISAYTFTGAAGVAFTAGWSVAAIYIGNSLGFLINCLLTAPWFRQLRAITAPEVIRMRYGVATQQFYATLNILMGVLGSGLTLWALAIFSSAIFGFNVELVILIIGVVVLIYSTTGGSWAVMATDFVQSLILFPMTILLAVLCLIRLGGFGGLFEMIQHQGLSTDFALANAPDRFPNQAYTWGWIIALIVKQSLTANTMGAGTRYFAVKDGREARKAALLAFVLSCIGATLWFIPPMTARLLYESQVTALAGFNNPAEAAFAVVSRELLPTGMLGLMVVAMFAATMSSLDTGLNRNAAIFIQDVYPALCHLFGKHPADQKRLLRFSRLFSLIFGCLIILVALYFAAMQGKGMFQIMLSLGALLGIPMTVPLLLGIFIRRVPWWSAFVSICCGFVVSAAAMISDRVFGAPWTYQTLVAASFGVSSLGFLVTMPMWRYASERYQHQTEAFFKRMHTPVDFEREVGQANDTKQLQVIGWFVMVISVFIAGLLLIPNSTSERVSILAVAAFMGLIGAGLLWAGARGATHKKASKPAASPSQDGG